MEESTLKNVPNTVFGIIQPSVAIFSTPNADFNVVFPNMVGFRHEDHKFEWTREEFQCWYKRSVCAYVYHLCTTRCSMICAEYGYSVEYSGVGSPPPTCTATLTDIGYCTQIATFKKVAVTSRLSAKKLRQVGMPYELVIK